MSLYKPSVLLDFLQSVGITPKKGLSQHFLIDGNVIRKILAVSHLQSQDQVIEIGPGPGVLTEALLQATISKLYAFEKDELFGKELYRLQNSTSSLEVFIGDFLEFPLRTLFSPQKPLKVIANLPYNITKPILLHLFDHHDLFTDLVLMMQEEVAKKILSPPSNPTYGPLTLISEFYSKATIVCKVSPSSFFPKPKVRSAIVHFVMKKPPLLEPKPFFHMIQIAFQKRRKQLAVALETLFPKKQIHEALEHLQLPITLRAEDLTLTEFLSLFERISK
ncbi:MAG: 16S rRNA (adenine(1518)-N(6)/adenine(1519)-N(6))-dimethyltransferase RsmA [Chlamydiota bacterium]